MVDQVLQAVIAFRPQASLIVGTDAMEKLKLAF
jgi:hypothetical protein